MISSAKRLLLTAFAALSALPATGAAQASLQKELARAQKNNLAYLSEKRTLWTAQSHLLGLGYKEISLAMTIANPPMDTSRSRYMGWKEPRNGGSWTDPKSGKMGQEFTFHVRRTRADTVSTVMIGCFHNINSKLTGARDVTCVTRQRPFNPDRDLPSMK